MQWLQGAQEEAQEPSFGAAGAEHCYGSSSQACASAQLDVPSDEAHRDVAADRAAKAWGMEKEEEEMIPGVWRNRRGSR